MSVAKKSMQEQQGKAVAVMRHQHKAVAVRHQRKAVAVRHQHKAMVRHQHKAVASILREHAR